MPLPVSPETSDRPHVFLLDRFIPPALQADFEALPRARMVIGIVLASMAGEVTFCIYSLLLHDYPTIGLAAFGLVFHPINLAVLWKTKKVGPSAAMLVGLWVLSMVGGAAGGGAVSVTNSGWPIFSVLLTTYLLGARAGVGAAAALGAALTAIGWAQRTGLMPPGTPPSWVTPEGAGVSLLVLMLLCALIGALHERAHRRLLDEITRTNAGTLRSEASLRSLLNSSRDLICSIDRDRRVLEMNEACRAAIELRRVPIPMRGGDLFTEVLRDSLPVVRERIQACVDRALAGQNAEVEETFASVAGARIFNVAFDPIRLPDNSVVGVTISAHDITERRQLESRAMISDRMTTVGTLAAGVAHELNNPLAYVMANLEYIDAELFPEVPLGAGSSEGVRAALVDASEGAERMRVIIRDLKTFSRAEGSDLGRVDVGAAIESAVKMCWNELRHRAQLVRELGEVPAVWGNEARLGQVVLNLMVNAIHATPEGEAQTRRITVRTLTRAPTWVIIEITDMGTGIAAENLKRIFDPFFTTKPVGIGMGLGLSICHNATEAMGGHIEVESVLGQGSTFRIVLPQVQAQPASLAPEPASFGLIASARVLLVDDEEGVGRGLTRTLSQHGHHVTAETSGARVLERLEKGERFDLMICDLMMPEMTGMELFEHLERIAPDQVRRLAFISGGTFSPQARAFVEKVRHPVLDKPCDIERLLTLISQVQRTGTTLPLANVAISA